MKFPDEPSRSKTSTLYFCSLRGLTQHYPASSKTSCLILVIAPMFYDPRGSKRKSRGANFANSFRTWDWMMIVSRQSNRFPEEVSSISRCDDSYVSRCYADATRQLVAAVVEHAISQTADLDAILIFMPGVQEIRQCIDAIRSSSSGDKLDIFPLHANLTSEEQRRCFARTSRRKVVVATNVAEVRVLLALVIYSHGLFAASQTSITIDDIACVIECGKVKETQFDPQIGLCKLVETWTSQASINQRRGRAGRTKAGNCYRLYTRKMQSSLKEFSVPEISRVPLENLLLSAKATRPDSDVKVPMLFYAGDQFCSALHEGIPLWLY